MAACASVKIVGEDGVERRIGDGLAKEEQCIYEKFVETGLLIFQDC